MLTEPCALALLGYGVFSFNQSKISDSTKYVRLNLYILLCFRPISEFVSENKKDIFVTVVILYAYKQRSNEKTCKSATFL